MLFNRPLFWIYLLWAFAGQFIALQGQGVVRPEIINFSSTQYKAQSQNSSVTQNPEGLLFFANNQGLLTYDGASWQHYPMVENQILRTVASDGKGRIYGG